MDRQQIGLKLALDALGIPVRLDSFTDRLTVQKCVYLAQAAGIQLGYTFHWYLRGPYSRELKNDVFGVVAEVRTGLDESRGWSFDPTSSKRAARLRELITNIKERAEKLELLASVHFLIASGAHEHDDAEQLSATLRRYDLDGSADDVRAAIDLLEQHGLRPAIASREAECSGVSF